MIREAFVKKLNTHVTFKIKDFMNQDMDVQEK